MDGSYGSYGFPALKVTDASYGWFLWFLWLFGLRMAAQVGIPASKLRMVPMDGSYGSYGCWVANGCTVGVLDRMSVHVLDEEQLAPLRVR